MRNSIKKWICIMLAMLVFASTTVYAKSKEVRQIYQNDDYIYEILPNETIAIHFFTGDAQTVTIPRNIEGIPVREIESYAFYGTQVKEVIISEGITTICDETFYNCSLETLQLPSTLKSIGMGAFRSCKELTSITIPSGVSLSKYMFYGCTSLSDVTLPSEKQIIQDGMFAFCTSLKSINLPEKIREIKANAFYSSGLTSLEISSSLKYIEEKAFAGCKDLESITAKQGHEISVYIKENSFEDCKVQFPDRWNSAIIPTAATSATDPTEPSIGTTVDATTPQPPIEPSTNCPTTPTQDPTEPMVPPTQTPTEPTTVSPTVEPTITSPDTEAPTTEAPTTEAPETQPPTASPTECPTTDNASSDEVHTWDDYLNRDGFYIGESEGFREFEDYCALSTNAVVANNKKELLELTWNVRTRGDVNNDNFVNVKDATAIQKYSAGIDLPVFIYKNADVNTDGKVNVKDATAIQKFVAGLGEI